MPTTPSFAPTTTRRVRAFRYVLLTLLLALTVGCPPARPQQLAQIVVPVDRTLLGAHLRGVSSPMPVTINKTQLDSAAPNQPVTAVAPQLPPGSYFSRAARVTLKFNDAPFARRGGASWGYTVNFTITPNGGAAVQSALTVNRGMDREAFEAFAELAPLPADGATLSVTGVSSPDPSSVPGNITLEFSLTGEPNVAFDVAKAPSILFHPVANTVELQSLPAGAAAYEFEWAYIDDYDPLPGYTRPLVRARSPGPIYRLDLTYPGGKVLVRGRALGRFAGQANDSAPTRPGPWSRPVAISVSNSCGANPSCVPPVEGKMNWHYASSFAESADAVSRFSLFDGSLRVRQTQRRMRTQGERLISETSYDTEGRGRIKVLPAPIAGETYGNVPTFSALDVAPNTTAPYDQQAFDGVTPPPISSASGVGKYYSSAPGAATPDAYVPNADGHPFAAVEPVRDQTSRPRRVGGYGAALALDSGHETLFRYGTAASTVLHKLFGRNVGLASYYERSLQIDPNRQAHVAYVDRSGRTIASGLAGDAPTPLQSIGPTSSDWVTYRLDQNNVVDVQSGVSRSVSSIAVVGTQSLFFNYDLKGIEYSIPGDAHFPPVCETCRYQLTIKITDQEGRAVPLCKQATPADPSHADCSCSNPSPPPPVSETLPSSPVTQNICRPGDPVTDQTQTFSLAPDVPVQFCAKLTDGEYEVVKELKANDQALTPTLTSDITSTDFIAANAVTPATTDTKLICGQDCKSFCLEATGDPTAASNAYKSCVQSCQNPQVWAFGASATRSCDSLQAELDRDYEPNGILAGRPKPHPEQCRVDVCRKRNDPAGDRDSKKSSDAFDDRMMAVDNYSDALACGYLDPLGGTPGAPAISGVCPPNLVAEFSPASRDHDPVFDTGAYAAGAKPLMAAAMGDFTDNMPGFNPQPPPTPAPTFLHKSIWAVAADSSLYIDAAHPKGGAMPTPDQVWRMFRGLYFDAKQARLAAVTADPAGGNCAYWTDPRAHFKPFTFNSIQDVAAEAQSLENSYAQAFCPIRMAQWLTELEQTCPPLASSGAKLSISKHLSQYCTRSANSGDFFAALTSMAIASDPDLLAADQQLSSVSNQCSLGKIAIAPPFLTEAHACPRIDLVSGVAPANPLKYSWQNHDACSRINPGLVAPNAPTPDQRLLVCQSAANDLAAQQSQIALASATDRFNTFERQAYLSRCLGPQMQESFSYQFAPKEYHYTLQYYDQAGNLVETVPPAGVHPLNDSDAAKLDADPGQALLPDHGLISRFQYNSIGKIVRQETPDSSWTRFWYDHAGQLRFFQTAQQEADKRYSYIKYDPRGRIVETGLVAGLPDLQSIMAAAAAANHPLAEDAARTYLDQLLDGFATLAVFPTSAAGPQFTTEQVVSTTYDEPANVCKSLNAQNLRGRVSSIVAQAQGALGEVDTCYSYDPHGNISSLLQRLPGLGDKRVDYDYDILDGKIIATHYQSGFSDALHHQYTYDADRRLIDVETSRDQHFWERDAAYSYYRHGPLARLELGADRVQGLDYLYSITGSPKGVNADSLDPTRDPGGDGLAGGANPVVARDVFGSAVHYFAGDYAPVGSVSPQLGVASASALARASCSDPNALTGCGLFDGNVAATVQSVGVLSPKTLGTAYRYDQLSRLRASTPFADPAMSSNAWPASSNDPNLWRTVVNYDENGNISTLNRHAPDPTGANPAGQWMDLLTYRYPLDPSGHLASNRLLHINDNAPPAPYNSDLVDQGIFDPANLDTANYAYDLSGRLTRDRAAGLNGIVWNAASRISRIERRQTSARKYNDLEFVYDGLGNRIAKIAVIDPSPAKWQYEYFVRDAKGQILATYKKQPPVAGAGAPTITLEDQTIFGASRLGTWAPADPPWAIVTLGGAGGGILIGSVSGPGSNTTTPAPTLKRYAQVRGAKQYELSNYLGNVFAAIKDRKREIPFGNQNGPAPTHYEVDVASANDYDPFGSLLYERNQVSTGSTPYRYGFSGLERDDDIKDIAGSSYYTNARLFDPRVGRWLSPDPVPTAGVSPFIGFANNPLRYSDPRGTQNVDSLRAQIQQDLSSKNWIATKQQADHAAVEQAKRRVAAENGPQLSASDPLWLQAARASSELPLVNPDNRLEPIIQAPVVAYAADIVFGLGFPVLVFQDLLSFDAAAKSGDPVSTAIAGIGVLTDAALIARGVRLPEIPAEPWNERPWDPCGSFDPSTPVVTDRGQVPIRDIKIGDLVVSGDETTGATARKRVEKIFGRTHDSSIRLEIRRPDGKLEHIITTVEHPFWVKGRGWTPAEELFVSQQLRTERGWDTVNSVQRVNGRIQTYNLSVAELHTFFVGDDGLWVHNGKPCFGDMTRKEAWGNPSSSKAASDARAAGEGKPCPGCGETMKSGTPTAPQAQHEPSLYEVWEQGADKWTPEERRAYARDPKAFNGAQCKTCQQHEGRENQRKAGTKGDE